LITQKAILSLYDVTKKKPGLPEITKGYWNTFYCQNRVFTVEGRVYGKYCKNRFCTLCCANRKADIINRYLPVIKTWEKPHLVTLTVKAVSFKRLKPVMQCMIKAFRAIVETYRKRHQRGKGIKLVGIRSLESNFNSIEKWYNPHLHCVVANEAMADILVNEWLRRSKEGWTSYKSQDIKPVFNNLSAIIEVVKYGSKIFTEPDLKKKSKLKGEVKIFAAALNNIFHAMKGLRIFERFGFDLSNQPKQEISPACVVQDYREWVFNSEYSDWIDTENGHCLTNYQPPDELLNLLETQIDIDLE